MWDKQKSQESGQRTSGDFTAGADRTGEDTWGVLLERGPLERLCKETQVSTHPRMTIQHGRVPLL